MYVVTHCLLPLLCTPPQGYTFHVTGLLLIFVAYELASLASAGYSASSCRLSACTREGSCTDSATTGERRSAVID